MNLARNLLYAGMLAGLAIALWDLLDGGGAELPPGIVAQVDGHDIPERDVIKALDGLNRSRRTAADADDRARVIERLIDEQLLVSHALELDLVRQDPRLRKLAVDSVLALLRADAEALEAEPERLAAFYRDNADYFRQPDRYRARLYRPRDRREAAALRAALAAGEQPPLPADPLLPDTLVTASKLPAYLGAALSHELTALQPGDVSPVLETGSSLAVLHLVQHRPGRLPPLANIHDQVLSEWRRREGERRMRQLLERLRDEHRILRAGDE